MRIELIWINPECSVSEKQFSQNQDEHQTHSFNA